MSILKGSYSLKKVLPVLVPGLSYDGMEIGNGVEAFIAYSQFENLLKKDKEKYDEKYKALINYCKQDTWAMVEIIRKIRQRVD